MTGTLKLRENLNPHTKDAMYRLLQTFFRGVTPEIFNKDLAEKNWVLLLYEQNELVGFSTLLLYPATFHGESITVLYSGDTIVALSARSGWTLAKTWISAVWQLHANCGTGPLWWLLITSGYRTYRFLPVFWRQFYPCCDHPIPAKIQNLRKQLGSDQFGKRFNPATGIVKLEHAQPLRQKFGGIPEGKLDDPHVAFFSQANPGHTAGDELLCLTPLTHENLTRAGQRMVEQKETALP